MFEKLHENKDGNVFYDIDQGWELSIDRVGDDFVILEKDPDEDEVYCNIRVDGEEFLNQICSAERRVDEIINRLVNHFKIDYWSKY